MLRELYLWWLELFEQVQPDEHENVENCGGFYAPSEY